MQAQSSAGRLGMRVVANLCKGALFAAALTATVVSASAQTAGIVQPTSAVVTGFSGYGAGTPPPGATDPYDYATIDTGGPSARVVDLSALGAQGSPSGADKPFSVTAAQVGQVFGVALDGAPQPNIFLAATSAYGLSIFTPDAGGLPQRIHTGAAGAAFVAGQFGPGGGPNSIWRVDGTTGAVTPFATVGSPGSVAGLGGLAFDRGSQQLFAVDRGTGIIYRFGLDGTPRGAYDHGTEGHPGAGLPLLALAPQPAIDIQSPSFDTGNPQTWGFAPTGRRVFALAAYKERLYYSVAQGPQVWSAQIDSSGALNGSTARVEVEVPSLADGEEIASIAFDSQGRMYLAERGPTSGDYQLTQLARGGTSRVLRFTQKAASDPSPGFWTLTPDVYSIGLPPVYANADGGVALGYSRAQDGQVDTGACSTVWSTGDRLLDPADSSTGFPNVNGLQGNESGLVQPANMPPASAWFIDYDDQPGDAVAVGDVGAVATIPCGGRQASVPPPPVISCPGGTYYADGQCYINPICNPGQTVRNGKCSCPTGLKLLDQGYCGCRNGGNYFGGKCYPPQVCPPGSLALPGGLCICPLGLFPGNNGSCVPPPLCPPNTFPGYFGHCLPLQCPKGEQPQGGTCVPINCNGGELYDGVCVPKCPKFLKHLPPDGHCGLYLPPPPTPCVPPNEWYKNMCVPKCGFLQHHSDPNGVCVPTKPNLDCGFFDKDSYKGQCVDKCGLLQHHSDPDGVCVPNNVNIDCGFFGKDNYKGQCVAKCGPLQHHSDPSGVCVSNLKIPPGGVIQLDCAALGKDDYKGGCVAKCGPLQHHSDPGGVCVSNLKIPPGGVIQLDCAALGKDDYKGGCVAKCGPLQHHSDPSGVCVVNSKLNGVPPLQVNPNKIILSCAAQGKDDYNGKCVARCAANEHHAGANGVCVVDKFQINPKALQPPKGLQLKGP